MPPVTSMVQFPWPLILAGGIGLALAVGVSLRGLRRAGLRGVLTTTVYAIVGASGGAFVALIWLWVVPMSNRAACLYTCAEKQFLSNEQLRQIVRTRRLAWILPVTALLSGIVAVWSWKRRANQLAWRERRIPVR